MQQGARALGRLPSPYSGVAPEPGKLPQQPAEGAAPGEHLHQARVALYNDEYGIPSQ